VYAIDVGDWVDGKRQGKGEFIYSSGAKYEGEWKENKKHGQGRYISQNGRIYEGLFENDRAVKEFVDFNNDTPFHFRLTPSMTADATFDVLLELNSIVRRHAGALRSFYETYSSKTLEFTKDSSKHVISRILIWKMIRDIGLTVYDCSIATLDRTYAELFKDDPCFSNRYHDPHGTDMQFIYYDFLEYLIHISVKLFRNRPDLSIHESKTGASFSYLIKNHILPYLNDKNRSTDTQDEYDVMAEVS
jgi:hypothetical protein